MDTIRKIINPLKDLKEEHLPIFVFFDDVRSFVSWLIRSHTKGNYNHVAMMVHLGKVASQTFGTYKEYSIEEYMRPKQILKFWRYKSIVPFEASAIQRKIEAKLSRPWWQRQYDYLGILGQFFKVNWLNNPWQTYCSEDMAECLRIIRPIKDKIPKHPSPVQ